MSNQEYSIPVVKEGSPVKHVVKHVAADPIKKMNGPSKFPHNWEAILKEADAPVSLSSANFSEHLRSGVFLKHKTIKFWVDERSKSSCFMLFPKALSITWSDKPEYWTYIPAKESPNETVVETAELKNVCWLDVTGKFDTRFLTPGTAYEVVFKVKLQDPAFGWETPVNLKLVFPNGKNKPQEQKRDLRELPRYTWVDITVGEFVADINSAGEMTFSMYEHEAGVWKKGLFLKGVAILPKHAN